MKNLRWLFWVLVIGFIWVLVSRLTEIEKLANTLRQGQWQWVLVAALLQVIYYIVYAALYQASFSVVEVRSRLRGLVPVMFASIFMNSIAVGAASGSALFIDDARRRGESPARAAAGVLLVLVADFGAFLIILLAGMIYLLSVHNLKIYEIIGAGFLLLMIGGMAFILLVGVWSPNVLNRLLHWVRRTINHVSARFKKPDLLHERWVETTAAEFLEASLAISAHPQRLAKAFGIAFAAHLVDIASLLAVFLAFHQIVSIGVLISGYAIGILFWIISVTPQGIGVVEGMMSLVFTSLGVPSERATIVALAFRGLTFWLPMLAGFVLLRTLRIFNPKAPPVSRNWSVRFVAAFTALMGVVNVLSALTPSLENRLLILEKLSPLGVIRGSHLTSALAGFALLMLARELLKRKRIAWFTTLLMLGVSALSHIFKGLDYEEATLAVALAGWLIYLRAEFHAHSDTPSVRQGLSAILAGALFTLVYGTIGFFILDRHFKVIFSLPAALRQTLLMFTSFYNPGLEPVTGFGAYFAGSIYFIAMVTFSYALLMLVRPVLIRQPATVQERQRAREIISAHGRTTLAPFALFEDKSYFFSSNGSLVNFVQQGNIALTLGDPIGAPEDTPAAILEFCRFCDTNSWQPAFYQVLPDHLPAYRAAGFQQVCIGQDALVDLNLFSLEGADNKSLRSAWNKLIKAGYHARVLPPPQPQAVIDELKVISDAWLALVHGSEKRFSLGWFHDDYIRACPIMVISDPQERTIAFTNILSEFQQDEATIDLMRHLPEAPNGTMDFLFVSLFTWAKENGFHTFNLGLSSLAGVGESPRDPAVEHALHYIYEHINQFYNFKGLHHFKEKFKPLWSPRYLIYRDLASLPLVTLAMIRADSGSGMLGKWVKL